MDILRLHLYPLICFFLPIYFFSILISTHHQEGPSSGCHVHLWPVFCKHQSFLYLFILPVWDWGLETSCNSLLDSPLCMIHLRMRSQEGFSLFREALSTHAWSMQRWLLNMSCAVSYKARMPWYIDFLIGKRELWVQYGKEGKDIFGSVQKVVPL